jgi:hypothetical protein
VRTTAATPIFTEIMRNSPDFFHTELIFQKLFSFSLSGLDCIGGYNWQNFIFEIDN